MAPCKKCGKKPATKKVADLKEGAAKAAAKVKGGGINRIVVTDGKISAKI